MASPRRGNRRPPRTPVRDDLQQVETRSPGQIARGRVIAAADGDLLHLENGEFVTKAKGAILQLVELPPYGSFIFALRMVFLGEVHLELLITQDSRIFPAKDGRRLEWIVITEDGHLDSWRAQFYDPGAGLTLNHQVIEKYFEVKNQEEFSFAFPDESDRRFVQDAHAGSGFMSDDSLETDSEEEEEEEKKQSHRLPRSGQVNDQLLSGMAKNRTFTVSLDRKSQRSGIDVMKHDEYDQLQYVTSINDIKDKEGNFLTPTKTVLHQGDEKMLLFSNKKPNRISLMDLSRETVVDEFDAVPEPGHPNMETVVRDFGPISKYASTTGEPTFQAISTANIFRLDPRLNAQNKYVANSGFSYKTNPRFRAMATTRDGKVVVASERGEVRLYSDPRKRAKNLFPGVGDEATYITASNSGDFVLITTPQYLLLIPTSIPDDPKGRTGFDVRMGKTKPQPIKLQLAPTDLIKYDIRKVNFTRATFNTGSDDEEKWIFTSTGPYAIVWSLKGILKGSGSSSYRIQKLSGDIVSGSFRHNFGDQVLAATQQDVYSQMPSKKKK